MQASRHGAVPAASRAVAAAAISRSQVHTTASRAACSLAAVPHVGAFRPHNRFIACAAATATQEETFTYQAEVRKQRPSDWCARAAAAATAAACCVKKLPHSLCMACMWQQSHTGGAAALRHACYSRRNAVGVNCQRSPTAFPASVHPNTTQPTTRLTA